MSFTIKYCYLIIFIFILYHAVISGDNIISGVESHSPNIYLDRFTVYIGNNDVANLHAHCHSFDDDIGDKALLPNQQFHWSFKQNFLYSTFFSCNFSSLSTNRELIKTVVFNVFDFDISIECRAGTRNCHWLAKDDGFYFSLDNKPFPDGWTMKHTWKW